MQPRMLSGRRAEPDRTAQHRHLRHFPDVPCTRPGSPENYGVFCGGAACRAWLVEAYINRRQGYRNGGGRRGRFVPLDNVRGILCLIRCFQI